jgi:hypothetical protein
MDIDSVLGDLKDTIGAPGEPPILEEFNRLDRRAFELARLVARDPTLRAQFEDETRQLTCQAEQLVERLEREHPDLHDDLSDRISESFLDLSFVETESDDVSFRLGVLLP